VEETKKRILGIDYGSRRIGIAVCDPLRIIAKGVKVVSNTPNAIEEIKHIAMEYDVASIVIGMPLNLKGEKGMKAEEVERFIEQLSASLGIEIIRSDERFTSQDAQQTLLQMGVKKKQRQVKGTIDEMAAALILQQFLDHQNH
jgi:putative Holliday junction resolvase